MYNIITVSLHWVKAFPLLQSMTCVSQSEHFFVGTLTYYVDVILNQGGSDTIWYQEASVSCSHMTGNNSYASLGTVRSAQLQIHNFLDRPSGWKCFLYHFAVWVYTSITYVYVGCKTELKEFGPWNINIAENQSVASINLLYQVWTLCNQ